MAGRETLSVTVLVMEFKKVEIGEELEPFQFIVFLFVINLIQ